MKIDDGGDLSSLANFLFLFFQGFEGIMGEQGKQGKEGLKVGCKDVFITLTCFWSLMKLMFECFPR